MLKTDITDNDLIALVLKKDIQAVEFIYDKYSPLVYGLIRSWLPGLPNIAEQVLYDVFIVLHHKIIVEKNIDEGLFVCLYRLARKIVNDKIISKANKISL